MRNSSPIATGQTIANKYVVERVLGEGGMGLVVAAWHLGLEQRVAIKFLLREKLQHDDSAFERFQREARAAARIRSEHVCRVLDTGALEDGTPFMVMEYLEGLDLADELIKRGRIPAGEAIGLVRVACEALIEAHGAGIVHRDLKPANLFLVERPDGTRLLKVLDFGVSKSISSSGTPHRTLTKTAALVGSPIYMSPEQLNSSKDVDGRTDIWALGIILYELITGRAPFSGETIPQLVNSVLNSQPEPLSSLKLELPAGLEDVLLRALAKSRTDRFASVQDFSRALLPYAPDPRQAVSRTVKVSSASPDSRGLPVGDRQRERASEERVAPTGWSRRRWAALVVLLIAGAGVTAGLSRRSSQVDVTPPATTRAALPIDADASVEPRAPELALGATGSLREQGDDNATDQPATSLLVPVPPPPASESGPAPAEPSPRTAREKKPRNTEEARGSAAAQTETSPSGLDTRPSASEPSEAAARIPQENQHASGVSNFGGRR